jgi:hypothetical protein
MGGSRFAAFSIIVALSVARSAAAEERPTVVAVFPIEDASTTSSAASAGQMRALHDYFAGRLGLITGYSILPNSELKARLDAAKAESYKECYDEACQIEIGKEVAASKGVSTRIARVGQRCLITSYMYDLARAATDITATSQGGCEPTDLLKLIDDISRQFAETLEKRAADARAEAAAERAAKEAKEAREHSIQQAVTAPAPPPPPEHHISVGWIIGGAVLVGGGVVLDVAPASAHNHKLDPTDFIPVGLYALGAIAVAIGIL